MRNRRFVKVGRDHAVERDLYQQIEVELGEDPQCVARAFLSDLPVPQPRDQRMKVPRSHEFRREFQRRLLLGREIISERHLGRVVDRSSRHIISGVIQDRTEASVCLGRWETKRKPSLAVRQSAARR